MVKYLQHDDKVILVPHHISKFCIYTCQLILLNSIVIYSYHYNLLAFLNLCLYFSSISHWQKSKTWWYREKSRCLLCYNNSISCDFYILFNATFLHLSMVRCITY